MVRFTEALGLSRYSLFMQDYGGPVGFRMATAHPERVDALIVQNAVARDTGLGEAPGAPELLHEAEAICFALCGTLSPDSGEAT